MGCVGLVGTPATLVTTKFFTPVRSRGGRVFVLPLISRFWLNQKVYAGSSLRFPLIATLPAICYTDTCCFTDRARRGQSFIY